VSKKLNRRKFVKAAITGSSLLILGGCCPLRRPPEINFNSKRSLSSSPVLSTNNLFTSRDGYQPAIDAHSHFFNATDMQAGGYLAGPIASQWGINGRLMDTVGLFIDSLARRIAPSAYAEFQYLDLLEDYSKSRSSLQLFKKLEKDQSNQNALISVELYKDLMDTDFPEIYKENTKNLRSLDSNYELSEQLILNVLNDINLPDKATRILRSSEAKYSRASLSIFSFLGMMLSYRTHNIHKYRKAYFENSQNVKVICAANAMVDFDRWVGKCKNSYSSVANQIKLYDRLAKMHDNYIFNLISFNPWTAIKEGEKYFKLIESALDLDSFKGVKIYPPIGYYPMGNADHSNPQRPRKHPNLEDIDTNLKKMYAICKERNIPVMAHGNHSMGAVPEFKKLAGPTGWENALNNNDGLKVNIGHFGGDSDVDGNNWTIEFLELMKQHPGLMGDLGNWLDLLKPSEIDRFKTFLNYPISHSENGSDRILYGSDWFMISKDKGWENYAHQIYKNLKDDGVSPGVINQVFYENAKSFFMLDGYI
jgi:predicted TIM-barrel fold metal-dependent hydrolase